MSGIVSSPVGHSSEVQTYLERHKITKLFEDLLSKLVNELPSNPVDFLVSKLQIIASRKKTVATSAATGGRSKLQVSGSSVSPRPKTTTHGLTKPSSLRTPRAQVSLSSSPGSASKLARPSSSSSSIQKPGSRVAPRTSGSQLKPPSTTTPTRPNTAPSKRSTPKSSHGLSPSTKLSSSGSKTQPKSRMGIPTTKSALSTPRGKTAAETRPTRQGKVPKSPSAPTTALAKVKKPPSESHLTVKPASKPEIEETPQDSKFFDEEDEEECGGVEVEECSEDDGDGEGECGEDGREDSVIDDIIKLRESSTHSKKMYIDSLLAPPTSTETTLPSEGYWSEEGDEEDGEGVVVMEDYAALEEEGVDMSGSKKSKFTTRQAPPLQEQATVDLRLQICSHCARALGEGRDVSATETGSMVTATETDFESASQVGSHASFPQWTGSAVSTTTLGQSDMSEVMSDVTLQSHDTWGGIAPQPRADLPPSDVESEVHLPLPPPLEGQPWTTPDTPQDHFGWAQ